MPNSEESRDIVAELTSIAKTLEADSRGLRFPKPPDDQPEIRFALAAIKGGGVIPSQDLGKLIYYCADILEDIRTYV